MSNGSSCQWCGGYWDCGDPGDRCVTGPPRCDWDNISPQRHTIETKSCKHNGKCVVRIFPDAGHCPPGGGWTEYGEITFKVYTKNSDCEVRLCPKT